jgi:hypothetical protein
LSSLFLYLIIQNLLDDKHKSFSRTFLKQYCPPFVFFVEVSGENLMWTQRLLLNSMDEELHDHINSKLLDLPPAALFFLTNLLLKTIERTSTLPLAGSLRRHLFHISHRCCHIGLLPILPDWDSVAHDHSVPASLLHLSGFGPHFVDYLIQTHNFVVLPPDSGRTTDNKSDLSEHADDDENISMITGRVIFEFDDLDDDLPILLVNDSASTIASDTTAEGPHLVYVQLGGHGVIL